MCAALFSCDNVLEKDLFSVYYRHTLRNLL